MSIKKICFALILFFSFLSGQSIADEAVQRIEIADVSGVRFFSNSNTVGLYQKYELSFRLPNEYSNPFDPEVVDIQAHFTAPSGKEDIALGFWYQDYSKKTITVQNRRGMMVERDLYEPRGPSEWKIRYSPVETGEYLFYVTVDDRRGETRYPEGDECFRFDTVESEERGFIGVSLKNPEYFVFTDARTFFPVGHGPEISPGKLAKYAENRINIVQAEFAEKFKAGTDFPDRYNQERLYKFDEILRHAEDLGIYLQMGALVGWPEFAEDKSKMDGNAFWEKNNYNSFNGGPIEFPFQFDTDPKAKKFFKRMLRYYIARWGYSQNIFCWQLWGEFDMRNYTASQVGSGYFSERAVITWHQEMSEYIKSLDPRHLVTTAEAEATYDRIWRMPSIDFVTIHNYGKQIETSLPEKIRKYQIYKKPVFVQEYGPEPLLTKNGLNEAAVRAAYHNPLWRTVMMKLSGAPMKWTWLGDAREENIDMDKDYKVIAEFFAESDFANRRVDVLKIIDNTPQRQFDAVVISKRGNNRKIRDRGKFSPVDLYGIGNDKEAYIWIHDINYNLPQVQYTNYIPVNIEGVVFTLNGLAQGSFKVEFWNTRTGEVVEEDTLQTEGTSLTIKAPAFKEDLAVKVIFSK